MEEAFQVETNFTESRLKDGMKKINWDYLSDKVKEHGKCSVGGCYNKAEYMKLTKGGKGDYYRIYCKNHAFEKVAKTIADLNNKDLEEFLRDKSGLEEGRKVSRLPRFKIYSVYIPKTLVYYVPQRYVEDSIDRHRSGDFGILSLEDWQANEDAIKTKRGIVLSSYEYITPCGGAVITWWVKTDFAKRSTEVEIVEL